jgi:hypothetical protein
VTLNVRVNVWPTVAVIGETLKTLVGGVPDPIVTEVADDPVFAEESVAVTVIGYVPALEYVCVKGKVDDVVAVVLSPQETTIELIVPPVEVADPFTTAV